MQEGIETLENNAAREKKGAETCLARLESELRKNALRVTVQWERQIDELVEATRRVAPRVS